MVEHEQRLPLRTRLSGPTELEFCRWAGEAEPGEQFAYHRGFLALDASAEMTTLDRADRVRLRAVAESARWAWEVGLVHLVQRRIGRERFVYLAIARHKPLARRIALASLVEQSEAA